jgi:hypothetical protein
MHPPVIITVWNDHDEKVTAGKTTVSSKALSISMSDHSGTHVDAPVHFDDRPGAATIDQVPLENFYTSAICLDLSHVPLKHAITVPEMEAALKKSGQEIRPKDTVLLYMATNERLYGMPRYVHDFPGLALESVHWLADKPGLCRARDHPHRMSRQPRQAGRPRPLPVRRFPAQNQGRHRQPDPRRCDLRVKPSTRASSP